MSDEYSPEAEAKILAPKKRFEDPLSPEDEATLRANQKLLDEQLKANAEKHKRVVANLEAYAASGEDGPPLDLDSLTEILIAVEDPDPENLPGKLAYMHPMRLTELERDDSIARAINSFLDAIERLNKNLDDEDMALIGQIDMDRVVAQVAFEVELRRGNAGTISRMDAFLLEQDQLCEARWRVNNKGVEPEPRERPWRDSLLPYAQRLGYAKRGDLTRLGNKLSKIRAQIRELGPIGVYARAFDRARRVRQALAVRK